MSKREEGRFRGQFIGGFNRKDVLVYIAGIYSELEQFRAENEALRVRLEELEDLAEHRGVPAMPPVAAPMMRPVAEEPEDIISEVSAQVQAEMPSVRTENILATSDDLDVPHVQAVSDDPTMALPLQAAPMPPTPPVQPVQETPRLRPNLSNPYPERAKRVKVRPAREQG